MKSLLAQRGRAFQRIAFREGREQGLRLSQFGELLGRREGEGRPVQRAAAADCAYGRLVVEIKRLVPAQGVGSGWSLCENAHEPTRWKRRSAFWAEAPVSRFAAVPPGRRMFAACLRTVSAGADSATTTERRSGTLWRLLRWRRGCRFR